MKDYRVKKNLGYVDGIHKECNNTNLTPVIKLKPETLRHFQINLQYLTARPNGKKFISIV